MFMSHVTIWLIFMSHVTIWLIFMSHVTIWLIFMSHVTIWLMSNVNMSHAHLVTGLVYVNTCDMTQLCTNMCHAACIHERVT